MQPEQQPDLVERAASPRAADPRHGARRKRSWRDVHDHVLAVARIVMQALAVTPL
jgi:hypothetical protein